MKLTKFTNWDGEKCYLEGDIKKFKAVYLDNTLYVYDGNRAFRIVKEDDTFDECSGTEVTDTGLLNEIGAEYTVIEQSVREQHERELRERNSEET